MKSDSMELHRPLSSKANDMIELKKDIHECLNLLQTPNFYNLKLLVEKYISMICERIKSSHIYYYYDETWGNIVNPETFNNMLFLIDKLFHSINHNSTISIKYNEWKIICDEFIEKLNSIFDDSIKNKIYRWLTKRNIGLNPFKDLSYKEYLNNIENVKEKLSKLEELFNKQKSISSPNEYIAESINIAKTLSEIMILILQDKLKNCKNTLARSYYNNCIDQIEKQYKKLELELTQTELFFLLNSIQENFRNLFNTLSLDKPFNFIESLKNIFIKDKTAISEKKIKEKEELMELKKKVVSFGVNIINNEKLVAYNEIFFNFNPKTFESVLTDTTLNIDDVLHFYFVVFYRVFYNRAQVALTVYPNLNEEENIKPQERTDFLYEKLCLLQFFLDILNFKIQNLNVNDINEEYVEYKNKLAGFLNPMSVNPIKSFFSFNLNKPGFAKIYSMKNNPIGPKSPMLFFLVNMLYYDEDLVDPLVKKITNDFKTSIRGNNKFKAPFINLFNIFQKITFCFFYQACENNHPFDKTLDVKLGYFFLVKTCFAHYFNGNWSVYAHSLLTQSIISNFLLTVVNLQINFFQIIEELPFSKNNETLMEYIDILLKNDDLKEIFTFFAKKIIFVIENYTKNSIIIQFSKLFSSRFDFEVTDKENEFLFLLNKLPHNIKDMPVDSYVFKVKNLRAIIKDELVIDLLKEHPYMFHIINILSKLAIQTDNTKNTKSLIIHSLPKAEELLEKIIYFIRGIHFLLPKIEDYIQKKNYSLTLLKIKNDDEILDIKKTLSIIANKITFYDLIISFIEQLNGKINIDSLYLLFKELFLIEGNFSLPKKTIEFFWKFLNITKDETKKIVHNSIYFFIEKLNQLSYNISGDLSSSILQIIKNFTKLQLNIKCPNYIRNLNKLKNEKNEFLIDDVILSLLIINLENFLGPIDKKTLVGIVNFFLFKDSEHIMSNSFQQNSLYSGVSVILFFISYIKNGDEYFYYLKETLLNNREKLDLFVKPSINSINSILMQNIFSLFADPLNTAFNAILLQLSDEEKTLRIIFSITQKYNEIPDGVKNHLWTWSKMNSLEIQSEKIKYSQNIIFSEILDFIEFVKIFIEKPNFEVNTNYSNLLIIFMAFSKDLYSYFSEYLNKLDVQRFNLLQIGNYKIKDIIGKLRNIINEEEFLNKKDMTSLFCYIIAQFPLLKIKKPVVELIEYRKFAIKADYVIVFVLFIMMIFYICYINSPFGKEKSPLLKKDLIK